jgi:uncharacterized RmlC-like cupin family protein
MKGARFMAKLIRVRDIEPLSNEPPFRSRRGIDTIRSKPVFDTGYKTAQKPRMTTNWATIPPKGKSQRQYHAKCDSGMHILKGCLHFFFGPPYNEQQADAEAGDFVFVPQGEIHHFINLSETEAAEVITCFGNVSNWEEAETVFLEPQQK